MLCPPPLTTIGINCIHTYNKPHFLLVLQLKMVWRNASGLGRAFTCGWGGGAGAGGGTPNEPRFCKTTHSPYLSLKVVFQLLL